MSTGSGESPPPIAQAVNSVLGVFEQARSETLSVDEIPLAYLAELLAVRDSELPLIGTYAMSYLPADTDFSSLALNPTTAESYARFVIAESSGEVLDDQVNEARETNDMLHRVFRDQLAARRWEPVGAITSPGAASTASNMTIIIHGTHAATQTWWQPGGRFWSYIDSITSNVYGGADAYSWSGANKHGDRVQAAKDLYSWVTAHRSKSLDVVAHSHGGNVCFLATRLGLRVRKLITLGTPIRLEYLPDLRRIEILHNVFSTRDRVQTPTGTVPNRRAEGRTLGDGQTVLNHRATNDGTGKQPGHSDLHEGATWRASRLNDLI